MQGASMRVNSHEFREDPQPQRRVPTFAICSQPGGCSHRRLPLCFVNSLPADLPARRSGVSREDGSTVLCFVYRPPSTNSRQKRRSRRTIARRLLR